MLNLLLSTDATLGRKEFALGIILFDFIFMPLIFILARNYLSHDKGDDIISVLFAMALLFIYGNIYLITKRKRDTKFEKIHERIANIPLIIYAIYAIGTLSYVILTQAGASMLPIALIVFAFVAVFFRLLFYIIILFFLPTNEQIAKSK